LGPNACSLLCSQAPWLTNTSTSTTIIITTTTTDLNLDDGIVEVDRGQDGNLVPTAAMGSWKNLSDNLHAQGFQFGVYTDRGQCVAACVPFSGLTSLL
jgi:hypothetical protein